MADTHTGLMDKILAKFEEPEVLGALATVTEDGKPWVRYLMLSCNKDDLTLWTRTFANSRKVSHIRTHPHVHVTLGVRDLPTAVDWLQIEGEAEVMTDSETRHRMWDEHQAAYFSGPDDPNFAVIKVTPYRIEYQTMTSMVPEVWVRPA